MGPGGPYSDEFARAVLLLLRHHSDDSEVARLGLGLNNVFTPARDILLKGLYVQAKSRKSKGLAGARPYLEAKARYAAAIRKGAAGYSRTPCRIRRMTYRKDGRSEIVPPEDVNCAFDITLCDPESMRVSGDFRVDIDEFECAQLCGKTQNVGERLPLHRIERVGCRTKQRRIFARRCGFIF